MDALIYDRLVKKESKLAVIGLGYVGLPIALEFALKIKVVGFDINQKRVDLMKNKIEIHYNIYIKNLKMNLKIIFLFS